MTRQIIIISILTFFIIFIFLPVNKIFAQDRINVRDFGAKGNGIKDDSEAIQTAINEISATGGTVFLPPGVYKMKKGIEVPVGVNILGETNATTGPWQNYLDSQDKNLHHDYQQMRNAGSEWLQFDMYKGTWILVDHGKGDVNSLPTFKLSGNTSIKKIGFVHKGLPPATEKMEQYPPAIGVYSNLETPASREGVTIEDISLANPYIGIVFAIGDDLNNYYQDKKANDVARSLGRHRIHNVMGGPLYRGIMLKGLLDTVDIANIQFNYSNYESGYVVDRTQQAVDIEIARADGINLSNILSFGANKGLVTKPAFVNGTTSIRANNLNLEARIPISLTSGQYEITNSYFLTLNPFGYVEEGEFNGLKVETNSDTV
ncbi:MAG: glycosyl hydrolase family 28-related protein, partial [bacterium]